MTMKYSIGKSVPKNFVGNGQFIQFIHLYIRVLYTVRDAVNLCKNL